jgi:hypothetical protein
VSRFDIKLGGVYRIQHLPTGFYYIGMSVSIFSRWQSHYTNLKSKNHSSPKFTDLWSITCPTDWQFEILEIVSITEYKERTGLKGKNLEKFYRKELLRVERIHMSNHSKNYCLNNDDKYFS